MLEKGECAGLCCRCNSPEKPKEIKPKTFQDECVYFLHQDVLIYYPFYILLIPLMVACGYQWLTKKHLP